MAEGERRCPSCGAWHGDPAAECDHCRSSLEWCRSHADAALQEQVATLAEGRQSVEQLWLGPEMIVPLRRRGDELLLACRSDGLGWVRRRWAPFIRASLDGIESVRVLRPHEARVELEKEPWP